MTVEGKDLPELPNWLQELLPEPATPQLLAVTEDNRLELIQPDGSSRVFNSLEDAYNASRENDLDLNIADEVAKREGVDSPLLLTFPNGKGLHTLVFGYTDLERINSLKRAYAASLAAAAEYEKDPGNFVKAWNFVDRHPAFWTAPDLEDRPLYWVYEGHTNKLRLEAFRENGKVYVALETGSHVPPKFKEHYGDYRLDSTASTYEEAIVELARRVFLTHHSDGSDIAGADELFEKPRWIQEVEERIQELDEDTNEEDSQD